MEVINMKRAIGVLDSGVGGLTVVKELMRQLPKEEIIYIGDTERCPYGPRPFDEIETYTWELIEFLRQRDVKMIVIACNTATAVVLKEARKRLDIPVIGVIDPGARAAVKSTRNKHIGVIGTKMTVESQSYTKALRHVVDEVDVYSLACPPFVPLVEAGEVSGEHVRRVVKETLQPLEGTGIDSLILGCTHYPLLAPVIQDVIGEVVKLISSGDETALEVAAMLDYQELVNDLDTVPNHQFYATGDVELFNRLATEWLARPVDAKKVEVSGVDAS